MRHVQALDYSFSFVGDAAGTSGDAYITESYSDSPFFAAYAIYDNEDIARIAMINSEPFSTR